MDLNKKILHYLKIQRNDTVLSEAQPYINVLLKAWLLSGKSRPEQSLTLGTRAWEERAGAPPGKYLPHELTAGAETPTERSSIHQQGIDGAEQSPS